MLEEEKQRYQREHARRDDVWTLNPVAAIACTLESMCFCHGNPTFQTHILGIRLVVFV